jgi:hypothetical protein
MMMMMMVMMMAGRIIQKGALKLLYFAARIRGPVTDLPEGGLGSAARQMK